MPSNQQKVPDGFRVAAWDTIPVNSIIYRRDNPQRACRVTDPGTKTIVPIGSTTEVVILDADVLVKDGPFIVIVTQDDQFVAVYSDLEFDVYVAGLDTNARITRPLSCDSLTALSRQEIDELRQKGWPGIYGQWAIEKATATPKEKLSFDIGNRLAASALAVDLMRHGKPFEITPNREQEPTYFTFSVSSAVLNWIQQHASARLASEGTGPVYKEQKNGT